MIARNFGTFRGLVRLALAHGQVVTRRAAVSSPQAGSVKRLVFVCHGNICRSAFADVVARQKGLNSASFGLSTSSGKPANDRAAKVAATLGYPLDDHVTTDRADFAPQPGDYLLAMEVRQLHRLAADPKFGDFPRGLLGSFAHPAVPHLHDPYELDDAYMPVCLRRIERAVERLSRFYPAARLS